MLMAKGMPKPAPSTAEKAEELLKSSSNEEADAEEAGGTNSVSSVQDLSSIMSHMKKAKMSSLFEQRVQLCSATAPAETAASCHHKRTGDIFSDGSPLKMARWPPFTDRCFRSPGLLQRRIGCNRLLYLFLERLRKCW
ncbi:uncharacterized protein O9250_013034 [Rhynochetos jubatus]